LGHCGEEKAATLEQSVEVNVHHQIKLGIVSVSPSPANFGMLSVFHSFSQFHLASTIPCVGHISGVYLFLQYMAHSPKKLWPSFTRVLRSSTEPSVSNVEFSPSCSPMSQRLGNVVHMLSTSSPTAVSAKSGHRYWLSKGVQGAGVEH
jgi:hypothetical protein